MTTDEIRAYFAAKGISQREVGRFIGVDERTIRGWFAGRSPWPHLFILAVQADIFGVEENSENRIKNRLVLRRQNESEGH
jgi:transcriptional regulator with XRE-family HTH domain